MEPKKRKMNDPEQPAKTPRPHREKVIGLFTLLVLASLLSAETFPNNLVTTVQNVLAIPLDVFVVISSAHSIWRDPPIMKIVCTLIALAAVYGLIWNLRINFM